MCLPIWLVQATWANNLMASQMGVLIKFASIWLTVIVCIYKLADKICQKKWFECAHIESNKQQINGQKLSIWLFTFLFYKLNYICIRYIPINSMIYTQTYAIVRLQSNIATHNTQPKTEKKNTLSYNIRRGNSNDLDKLNKFSVVVSQTNTTTTENFIAN